MESRPRDHTRIFDSGVRAWSRSLDPIDSIGQLLSITVGLNLPVMGANIANSDIHLIILYVYEANGVAQARRWRLPYVTLATVN